MQEGPSQREGRGCLGLLAQITLCSPASTRVASSSSFARSWQATLRVSPPGGTYTHTPDALLWSMSLSSSNPALSRMGAEKGLAVWQLCEDAKGCCQGLYRILK